MTLSRQRPWEQDAPARFQAAVNAFAALVPVLSTPRLSLRAPRLADFATYARFVQDEPGVRSSAPDTHHAAWLDFCELVSGWPLRGFGPWTIDTHDGDRAVGAIVLNHEYGDPEPELGWTVRRDAEGQGFATEAARVALAHAFTRMGFDTLVSYIDPENPRSVAVAERLGARRDAEAEAALGNGIYVYRHPRPEGLA